MRFRLLFGQHIQTDADGFERLYQASAVGTILESPMDLVARFNGLADENGNRAPEFSKFERVSDTTVLTPQFSQVLRTPEQLALVGNPLGRINSPLGSGTGLHVQEAARQGYNSAYTDSGQAPPTATIPQPGSPYPSASDTLSEMTVEELRQFAESEEIDLQGKTRKAEILEIIRGAMV